MDRIKYKLLYLNFRIWKKYTFFDGQSEFSLNLLGTWGWQANLWCLTIYSSRPEKHSHFLFSILGISSLYHIFQSSAEHIKFVVPVKIPIGQHLNGCSVIFAFFRNCISRAEDVLNLFLFHVQLQAVHFLAR